MNEEVQHTAELKRILALPRRDANDPQWATLADEFTSLLSVIDKCPGKPVGKYHLCSVCKSPTRLRPIQALALHDIGTVGGLFGPIGVGEGKTLITMLAPYVLESQRPLLLLPAALIQKTEAERARLAGHWSIPNHIMIVSYEMLGRVQSAGLLDTYQPDLIMADEVHKLKNKRAAVTRRVSRFMKDHD